MRSELSEVERAAIFDAVDRIMDGEQPEELDNCLRSLGLMDTEATLSQRHRRAWTLDEEEVWILGPVDATDEGVTDPVVLLQSVSDPESVWADHAHTIDLSYPR